MSRHLSSMRRYFRHLSWLTLLALQIGFPVFSHAAEAPGGLTVIVKDQITDRPLAAAQITIAERETGATRSAETDAQGRIVLEQLDPGLYSVSVAKGGFA